MHMVILHLILPGPCARFSAEAAPCHFPTHSAQGLQFPPHPRQHWQFSGFLLVAILMGVQWDGCGFHLHSFVHLFWRNLYEVLGPFCLFFVAELSDQEFKARFKATLSICS